MINAQPFFEAIKAGDQATVLALLQREPQLATVGNGGLSAILLAAYYNQPALAATLARQSPRLSIYDAAAVGDVQRVARLLAERPELLDAPAADGFSALGLAAFFGQAEVVALLLRHGANATLPSHNEMRVTPLHSAVAAQHLHIATLLLDAGAQVDARQEGGFTALHTAAQNGQQAMVELLIRAGADLYLCDDDGRTAYDFAQAAGQYGLLAYLEQFYGREYQA